MVAASRMFETLWFRLGTAVGDLNYVRPLDLPVRSSWWRFTLTPGF